MYASVIVDSCSYFRLAQSISPLLKTPFCDNKFVLGVIKDLHEEYKKNPTLKNKFGWVSQPEYVQNRQRCFKFSKDELVDINNAFYFIRETARDEGLTTSKVDNRALAHAYVMGFPIVSDDVDLLTLAKIFEIKTYTSLQLLKILLDCGHIDMVQIRAIAAYWIYQNDTPASYAKDFKKLFNEPAPR